MPEQRYVIVGTAGHIDHGKTALVEALTGKNTDRLKEEQERGISIDIDFAPLLFPDGTLIGMVDVPGHERFVRNMVAGAAGIDAALLVIDINEGMKPQTYEHISILELLGVQQGIVALTKADLADQEWIEIASDILREELAGTLFATAPLVVTSVKTGAGLAPLRSELQRLAHEIPQRDASGAFRLPVDKVFTIPGIGSVVSGTAWRGQVHAGDVLELLPARTTVRVRGIQTHGQPTVEAQAGQRSALNIVGAEKKQLARGNVLAAPGTLTETTLLDVRVRILTTAHGGLVHRDRVHVHLGTAEVIGRVLLLETDDLQPGASSFAQLLLERPLVCEATDHFVIRSYSPVWTLGGGRVIDPNPGRLHRRKRELVLTRIAARDADSPLQRLLASTRLRPFTTVQMAMQELGVTELEATELLAAGVSQGALRALPSGFVSNEILDNALSQLNKALQVAHQKRRFEQVVPRALMSQALNKAYSLRDLDWLLVQGQELGLWVQQDNGVHLQDWEVRLTQEEHAILTGVLNQAEKRGLTFANEEDLVKSFGNRDRIAKGLLRFAVSKGDLLEVEPTFFIHRLVLRDAVDKLMELFQQEGAFTAGRARDVLAIGRKNAIALLEFLDRNGITKRDGDTRSVLANQANPFAN